MLSTRILRNATHHLVTLRRSPIGLPPGSARTLEALGLYRMHQSVMHPFSGPLAGKILAVKELVSVRNVTEDEGRRVVEGVRRNGEGGGFEVQGRAWGGGASTSQ